MCLTSLTLIVAKQRPQWYKLKTREPHLGYPCETRARPVLKAKRLQEVNQQTTAAPKGDVGGGGIWRKDQGSREAAPIQDSTHPRPSGGETMAKSPTLSGTLILHPPEENSGTGNMPLGCCHP